MAIEERKFIESNEETLKLLGDGWTFIQLISNGKVVWGVKEGEFDRPNIRNSSFMWLQTNGYIEEKVSVYPHAYYVITKHGQKNYDSMMRPKPAPVPMAVAMSSKSKEVLMSVSTKPVEPPEDMTPQSLYYFEGGHRHVLVVSFHEKEQLDYAVKLLHCSPPLEGESLAKKSKVKKEKQKREKIGDKECAYCHKKFPVFYAAARKGWKNVCGEKVCKVAYQSERMTYEVVYGKPPMFGDPG